MPHELDLLSSSDTPHAASLCLDLSRPPLDVGTDEVHGLQHPAGFLDALPVLHPPVERWAPQPPPASPSPSPELVPPSHAAKETDADTPHAAESDATGRKEGPAPIRALSAAQFAAVHAQYATTHAADGVLFPFLHGLEGDNDAQTAFFLGNGGEGVAPRVPRFRGLVWVASDEDEVEEYERALRARRAADEDAFGDEEDEDEELEDDDYSTSEENDGDELPGGRGMEIDVDVVGMDVDDEDAAGRAEGGLGAHGEGAHMHPVSVRGPQRPALGIDTRGVGKEQAHHVHRLSNASTTSTASSASSFEPSPLLDTPGALDTPLTPAADGVVKTQDEDAVMRDEDHAGAAKAQVPERIMLTSTFKPRELLCIDCATGETRFVEPRVPDGISLRNFGIQVPIFATLSDIVVYSPRGNTKAALAVATHFAHAVEAKRAQRAARGQTDLLFYNVFVLCASPEEIVKEVPDVVSRMNDEVVCGGGAKGGDTRLEHRAHTKGTDALTVPETHVLEPRGSRPASPPPHRHMTVAPTVLKANTISFAQREKDEMRELTQASEILTFPLDDDEATLKAFSASSPQSRWDPARGQVFLGNASDARPYVPAAAPRRGGEWDFSTNDPADGLGYDVCIECDDMAPFPSQAHLRAVEEHVARLERRWMDRCLRDFDERAARGETVGDEEEIPLRPPPAANLVVHIPFPSSVAYSGHSVPPFISWLETLLRPVAEGRVTYGMLKERERAEGAAGRWANGSGHSKPLARRSTNAATIGHGFGGYHPHESNLASFGGPSSLPPPSAFPTPFLPPQGAASTYTRMRSTSATHLTTAPPAAASPTSSPPPAHVPPRTRPLKVLVYSADGYTESSSLALCMLMALRRLSLPEAYLELQVEKRRSFFVYPTEVAPMKRVEARLERERAAVAAGQSTRHGRPAALSMSCPASNSSGFLGQPPQNGGPESGGAGAIARRPRASTLPPPLATVGDHQLWFNDPRFDGSFPSRVLPFLYLGNLNHAANVYMLHALGITHVVSVGECALVPPEHAHDGNGAAGLATAKPGSLWIEEREGRIKVLDIKGVCDDGIDSLEPQLTPICAWIDEARRAGGKVLVHCRVGVSRSATVTIAYVMKHLDIPLVDAYLIVRSRRLSVLIQPNMRLLYNLLGWEVKLAQERAGGDAVRLRAELARCLNWPYLAKEVHVLNEKYLRPPN